MRFAFKSYILVKWSERLPTSLRLRRTRKLRRGQAG
jgi:hypothetical protein